MIGEIEIPECREIADPGFVAETVVKRPVWVQRLDATDQTGSDLVQPFRVGKARVANKSRVIAGIRPITLFGFSKPPIYRPIVVPFMIRGIEIGRYVFQITA